ncbi:hypothetical protein NC652_001792 [Populus alba x Populus x berolinensis]|uniref:Uncharacterized protein n=1 Tax=Populus alba x Populus x berolinensis TaxID=444605 RepID=A0AAD6R2P8_9ROSI|nr:hypothetical protein NC652_025774 [Populus alba x Populus x berolinensis]KAJ6963275.1 hypothetical protein NC652_001792 [Populus alba x Populus x berolinensis]KAJ7001234.1 hypothetical protein NC653_011614 [Populus alba x Populus x berolinensis]KAJ7014268.1 hypothetical protein NC653_003775 [Populus alba x Populus x berolinensis]
MIQLINRKTIIHEITKSHNHITFNCIFLQQITFSRITSSMGTDQQIHSAELITDSKTTKASKINRAFGSKTNQ